MKHMKKNDCAAESYIVNPEASTNKQVYAFRILCRGREVASGLGSREVNLILTLIRDYNSLWIEISRTKSVDPERTI